MSNEFVPVMVVRDCGGYLITLYNQTEEEVYTRECEYLIHKSLNSVDFTPENYMEVVQDIMSNNYPDILKKMLLKQNIKPLEIFLEYKNILVVTIVEIRIVNSEPKTEITSNVYNHNCMFLL